MTTAAAVVRQPAPRMRPVDRVLLVLLFGGVRVLQALPLSVVLGGASFVGRLCYSVMPGRRARVRANLLRVCNYLAETQTGSARARRAASDARLLDRLVKDAFRHWTRTYAESAIAPGVLPPQLVTDTP